MLHSLRLRLLLTLVLVVAVAISLVVVFGGTVTTRIFRNYVRSRFEQDHLVAARALQVAGEGGSVAVLQSRAEELSQAMGSQIILVDPQGDVLVDSEGALIGKTLLLPYPPITSTASIEPFNLFFAPSPAQPAPDERRVVLVISGQPVTPAGWGEISIAPVGGEPPPLEPRLFGTINRSFWLAAGASGIGALGLAVLLSRRIISPIEALTAAARRMEKGDLNQRVNVRTRDEIGDLAHAFNAMAQGLARQETLRRTLVADVAHELRTPLSNIRGYLEAVRDRVVEPDPPVVDSLYEEAMLLTRLVDDLQELALAEAGQLTLEKRPTALRPLVESTLAAFQPQLAAKQITVTVALPLDLADVEADPERVGQILHNLVDNAARYTPAHGEIVIAARPDSEDIRVSVRDTGPGIRLEHLPNVFDRFYRADGSRARSTGGAGLGLAIVKQLVEAHGGRAWAESEAGRGAEFDFTLPVAAA